MIELSNVNKELLLLKELKEKGCQAEVLRLDKIHPIISGNKWFKLKYYLKDALDKGMDTLLTFGGAYSNHIIATACAAKNEGLKSIGIIRGEEPAHLSPTLQSAQSYGMKLTFVSRDIFRRITEENLPVSDFTVLSNNTYIIPEGGAGKLGRKGAGEILTLVELSHYSHIMCAVGTGTMFTGILNAAAIHQEIIGIPVLKGMNDLVAQYKEFIEEPLKKKYTFFTNYHFGGYTKKTDELLNFMNNFHQQTGVPTDFVYTGKLMYAFQDLLKKGYFKQGSRILLIHSGGLQGNNSLPEGTLQF